MNDGHMAYENGRVMRKDVPGDMPAGRNRGNNGRYQNYTGGGISATLDASYYKGPGARNGKEREFLAIETDARVYPGVGVTSKENASNPKQGDPSPTVSTDSRNYLVQEQQAKRKYIVRRLTPTECGRLQGYEDGWSEIKQYTEITDEEQQFWEMIRKQHAQVYGKEYKPFKTKQAMIKWLNKLRTDSSEYKAFGNSVAIPCVEFVMGGIAELIRKEEEEDAGESLP